MNATIVVYGSSTGTCEAIAEKIAQKLGCEVINVQDLTTDVVSNNKNLILGTSTWGAGELQDDWYDGLKVLQDADLSDKTIALFGCGDCESYSDTFVGGTVFLSQCQFHLGITRITVWTVLYFLYNLTARQFLGVHLSCCQHTCSQ